MQRTSFDFDVITGSSTPRPAPKPEPDTRANESAGTTVHRDGGAPLAVRDTNEPAAPRTP
jgi:hypothetical protein